MSSSRTTESIFECSSAAQNPRQARGPACDTCSKVGGNSGYVNIDSQGGMGAESMAEAQNICGCTNGMSCAECAYTPMQDNLALPNSSHTDRASCQNQRDLTSRVPQEAVGPINKPVVRDGEKAASSLANSEQRINQCSKTKKMANLFVTILRFVLLGTSIYAALPISENPKQREFFDHFRPYKYRMIYFTWTSLYFTILTSLLGIMSRHWGRFNPHYVFALSTSTCFNFITTVVFWILYFTSRKSIVNPNYLKGAYRTYMFTELSLHLFPLFSSITEQLDTRLCHCRRHRYFFGLFVILYACASYILFWKFSKFPYGFIRKMNHALRFAFYFGVFLLAQVAYTGMIWLNERWHKSAYSLAPPAISVN